MGVSQQNHHQTRHGMSADAEVNQNLLKQIAVALEKGNPLKRIAVALERGDPLKRIAAALERENPLKRIPVALEKGNPLMRIVRESVLQRSGCDGKDR